MSDLTSEEVGEKLHLNRKYVEEDLQNYFDQKI